MTDASVQDLEAISYGPHDARRRRFRGAVIHAAFLRNYRERRRVCPDCLRESLHHRAVWDLAFFSACPTHQRTMISACPACQRPLTWASGSLKGCSCQRCDLTSVPPQGNAPHPDILRGIAAASGLLGDERYRDEAAAIRRLVPLCELDPVEALEFTCRFAMDLTYGGNNHFGMAKFGRKTHDQANVLSRALRAIESWPTLFLDRSHVAEVTHSDAAQYKALPSGYSLMAWQNGVDKWLAELAPERGRSIRDFVEANPVFDG